MMEYLTPLQVLLALMQRKWDEGDLDAAAALARSAAPYVHPRAAVNRASPDMSVLTDAELDAYGTRRRTEATAEDSGESC